MFAFHSIIVVTTQLMSPALHKNFSEADFDFKVCVGITVAFQKPTIEIYSMSFLVRIQCLTLIESLLTFIYVC